MFISPASEGSTYYQILHYFLRTYLQANVNQT